MVLESGAVDSCDGPDDPDDPDNLYLDPDAADTVEYDSDSDTSVSAPLHYNADPGDDPYLDGDVDILPDRAASPLRHARRSPTLEEPLLNDIKTEYHPSSGRRASIVSFEEYDYERQPRPIPPAQHPWKPFRSLIDFEIAEVALEAALNRSQLDKLI